MRSFGFLLSRRWLLFALAVGVLGLATVWLGQWQFDRLEDRRAGNEVIRTNENLAPAPAAEVLGTSQEVAAEDEWRLVSASGTYAVEDTVVIRYRSRDGLPGVDAVVPLVTADGNALLVDRGFWATDSRAVDAEEIPAPPAGQVEVTGWVRIDGRGDSTEVVDLSARAISSEAIGDALERPVYSGFVELASEDPGPAEALEPVELPELNDGPHFFYGLQWWFFGLLAVFGFCYLAYDERKRGPRGERPNRNPSRRSRAADAERAQRPASTGVS